MRVYIAMMFIAFVLCAYWAGGRIAQQKCINEYVSLASERQNVNIKKLGDINAKVLTTDTADIRRILHEKYSISE